MKALTWILPTGLLPASAQSTLDAAGDSCAYAANSGWIEFRPSAPHGIVVTGTYFSGYAYSPATSNFKSGINVGSGVAAHCVAYSNSTDPATTDKNINVFPAGQRIGCVPISE